MPRALTIKKVDGKPGQVYYPLQLVDKPKPTPGPKEVLVRLHAAALNHRDLFIRQHLYPGISFEHPLLADGYGTVVETGPECSAATTALLHQQVILTPGHGWDAAPEGPEEPKKYSIHGGTRLYPTGMAQDFVVVPETDLEPSPPHLTPAEAAALPLVGLTAWRAVFTKSGNAVAGRNVLVTGIGGGVALSALQFLVAAGCRAYVTSGSAGKLARARQPRLGARGGACYREPGWEAALAAQLPPERPWLDAVIDGAGGDVVAKAVKLLKPGGVIVQYGMTTGPKMDWLMAANLRNLELRGTTMGSRREFADMVAFVREHKIRPVVSRVAHGGLDDLTAIDGLFEEMRDGKQFGKLVIEISEVPGGGGADSGAKL
ncbi:oxidoreductase [Xylariomycetidae sp. FL0641]|nr:oxidoreductase [Xylariomycetidae sp. FL0641]